MSAATLLFQVDDMNALNHYMRSVNPRTPKAFKLQLEWRPWFENLSWFAKTSDSNTLKEATRRRDAFDKANTPPPGKVVNEKGKELVMAAPTRLTIRKGSPKSQNVVDLQNILGLKPADGIFGTNTHNAVVDFQRKNGLSADGVVGPATWEKLLSKQVYVQAANNQAKQADAVKAAGVPAAAAKKAPVGTAVSAPLGSPVLRRGMVGPAVTEWQQKYLGIARPDGIFGPDTERLTKEWQVKHGLMGDGVVGPATRAAAIVAPRGGAAPAKPIGQQVMDAPGNVARAVAAAPARILEVVSSPEKIVETVKATPKKVTQTISRTVSAVTPTTVKRWPVWGQVVGTFVAGALGVGAYRKFTKK